MIIGEKNYKVAVVTGTNEEVLAIINDNEVVTKEGINVKLGDEFDLTINENDKESDEMNYYFGTDSASVTYLIVAKNMENAENIMKGSVENMSDIYELKKDTFAEEGFLIVSK